MYLRYLDWILLRPSQILYIHINISRARKLSVFAALNNTVVSADCNCMFVFCEFLLRYIAHFHRTFSLLYYVLSYNVIYSYTHRCDRFLLILRHGVSFTLKYLYFYAMHCNWYIDSINLSHVPLYIILFPLSSLPIFFYFFICFGQQRTLDSIYSVFKHYFMSLYIILFPPSSLPIFSYCSYALVNNELWIVSIVFINTLTHFLFLTLSLRQREFL